VSRTSTDASRAALPREARLLLAAVAIDALGFGLVLPFLVIYLHEVRDIPVTTVGVLAAVPAVVGLLLVGPIGVLIDRLGPRLVQAGAIACSMLGVVALAYASGTVSAFFAMVLTGVGGAAIWPANSALIASVLPSGSRTRYFGLSFTLLNAGIGVGGVVGALFVDVDEPSTFTTVYLADAVTFLAPLFVLTVLLRHVGGPVAVPHDAPSAGSYREVLSEPVFRRFLVLVFFTAFIGYGQIEAGWTAFSRLVADVSTRTIGLAFALNTAIIVVLQLLVLRRIEGRRRTRVLVVLAAIWLVAWGVMGWAGLVAGTTTAAVLVVLSMSVFAVGETLLSPIAPALTNDLAPEHLRGRYNAAASLAFQAAAITAPVTAGFLIGHDLPAVYVGSLLAGCVVFGALALWLEKHLPPAANGLRAEELDVAHHAPTSETAPDPV
jgi:MFS family permease